MNPRKVAARQKAKNARKLDRAPITDLTMSARSQLIAADVLSLEATRMRMAQATKGAFGSRSLRAAGSTANYMIGSAGTSTFKLPKRPPKAPKSPPRGTSSKPPTRRLPPSQPTTQRTAPTQPRRTTVRSHVVQAPPLPRLNAPKPATPQTGPNVGQPVAPKPLTVPAPRTNYLGGGR